MVFVSTVNNPDGLGIARGGAIRCVHEDANNLTLVLFCASACRWHLETMDFLLNIFSRVKMVSNLGDSLHSLTLSVFGACCVWLFGCLDTF